MVPTAAPVSGARGNHEEEPAEPGKPVEPAEPARPAEPEPVKPRAQDPEKVKETEPEKKQDKPEAKPAEQTDERPLQERVPLADPEPKPDGNETEEPKSKAKPAPKPGLVDKFRAFFFGRAPPSQQDSTGPGAWLRSLGQFECIFTLSIMKFQWGIPDFVLEDIGSSLEIKLIMHVAVGQAAAAEPPGAQSARPAAAKEVVEQPSAAAATPRSPEPPEAPPETERIPATPVESCFNCLIFGAFFFCSVLQQVTKDNCPVCHCMFGFFSTCN